jgi:3-isopropylmalate/(R)-2-methylmalate dehydratase small subunit
MEADILGTAAVLGDFVSADIVLPARHSFLPPAEMAANVLGEMGAEVNGKVRAHPILVVGNAFGYGTGRESPARALRAAGVKAIIGGPFARMFFRNCLNNGILALECPELAQSGVKDGDQVSVSIADAKIVHAQHTYAFAPIAPIVVAIVAAGGLIPYGKALLQEAKP